MSKTLEHFKMTLAVTEYDKKQSKRANYNPYALPQYFSAIENVDKDVAAGMALKDAIQANFIGRLCDVVLKSVNQLH
jgi:hypothetical protein